MKKIESFKVNHLTLDTGIYVSRKDSQDGVTVTTFDLRFTRPNREPVIDMPALHTLEHLGATYFRNSDIADKVVYFGPMGCRTGFYLLVRDIVPDDVIRLVQSAFKFMADYEGNIPGVSSVECGNYLEHDLQDAKREAAEYMTIIKNYTVDKLNY